MACSEVLRVPRARKKHIAYICWMLRIAAMRAGAGQSLRIG